MSEPLLARAGRRARRRPCRDVAPAECPEQGAALSADSPTIEEMIAVMHAAGDAAHGWRLRALIVILWRAGLR